MPAHCGQHGTVFFLFISYILTAVITFSLYFSSPSLSLKLPFKWHHLSLHLSESIHLTPLWPLVFCLILAVAQEYSQSSAFCRSRQLLSFTQVTFLNLCATFHLYQGSVPAVQACLLLLSVKGHGLGELR